MLSPGALLLKEAAALPGQALESGQFRHGPSNWPDRTWRRRSSPPSRAPSTWSDGSRLTSCAPERACWSSGRRPLRLQPRRDKPRRRRPADERSTGCGAFPGACLAAGRSARRRARVLLSRVEGNNQRVARSALAGGCDNAAVLDCAPRRARTFGLRVLQAPVPNRVFCVFRARHGHA